MIYRLQGQDHSSTLVSYYVLGVAFILEDCPLPYDYFEQRVLFIGPRLSPRSQRHNRILYSNFLLTTTHWEL